MATKRFLIADVHTVLATCVGSVLNLNCTWMENKEAVTWFSGVFSKITTYVGLYDADQLFINTIV